MSNERSFKEEKLGTKIVIITVVSFLLLGSIGVVIGAFYFGIVGLFQVLGVEYASLWSLLWFTLFYFFLSIFGDIVIKVFVILTSMSAKWSIPYKKYSIIVYSFFVNWAIVSLLNQWMSSIEIELITQMVFALLIALLDYVSRSKKEMEKAIRG